MARTLAVAGKRGFESHPRRLSAPATVTPHRVGRGHTERSRGEFWLVSSKPAPRPPSTQVCALRRCPSATTVYNSKGRESTDSRPCLHRETHYFPAMQPRRIAGEVWGRVFTPDPAGRPSVWGLTLKGHSSADPQNCGLKIHFVQRKPDPSGGFGDRPLG